MQEWAKEFYSSGAWKKVRELAKQRDHYLCVDCLRAGKITPAEEVHHIIQLNPQNIHDPNITLRLDNLKSLCRECHKRYDPKRVPRRYKVDEFGRVRIPEEPPGENDIL